MLRKAAMNSETNSNRVLNKIKDHSYVDNLLVSDKTERNDLKNSLYRPQHPPFRWIKVDPIFLVPLRSTTLHSWSNFNWTRPWSRCLAGRNNARLTLELEMPYVYVYYQKTVVKQSLKTLNFQKNSKDLRLFWPSHSYSLFPTLSFRNCGGNS